MASPGDLPTLEFSGKDANECENFISAVIKLAFAQGKQRDDAWIADFVATCLVKDALRWWIKLDAETQRSWDLLRRAMDLEYQPLFKGGSGEEVEKFVQLVYRRARDAGKQGNNQWIMEFVPTCLSGEALRWYSSLDKTTRTEWDSFRQAAFAQYPRTDELNSDELISSIVPTPAAAFPNVQLSIARQRGRIKLTIASVASEYYISKKIGQSGFLLVTKSTSDALEVEHDKVYGDLTTLHIPKNEIQSFDVIGIVWCRSGFTDPSNFAVASPIDSKTNKWAERSSFFGGPVFTKIWKLTPRAFGSKNCTLSAIFQNVELFATSEGRRDSSVLFYNTPRTINTVSLTFEAI